MNKERLERLASYLEETQARKDREDALAASFNYSQNYWLDLQGPVNSDAVQLTPVVTPRFGKQQKVVIKEGACGTAACVFGHAAFVPEFQEAGLSFRTGWARERADGKTEIGAILVVYENPEGPDPKDDFYGGVYDGVPAASRFFDIPEEDAYVLFSSTGNGPTFCFYTGLPASEFVPLTMDEDSSESLTDKHFYEHVDLRTVAGKLREYIATGSELFSPIRADLSSAIHAWNEANPDRRFYED